MHRRKSTWALIVWTLLMVAWLVASVTATATNCPASGGSADDCGAYVGIAASIVLCLWLVGAATISIIWYATRAKGAGGEVRWGDPIDPPPG